jgi:hypothetical protein
LHSPGEFEAKQASSFSAHCIHSHCTRELANDSAPEIDTARDERRVQQQLRDTMFSNDCAIRRGDQPAAWCCLRSRQYPNI